MLSPPALPGPLLLWLQSLLWVQEGASPQRLKVTQTLLAQRMVTSRQRRPQSTSRCVLDRVSSRLLIKARQAARLPEVAAAAAVETPVYDTTIEVTQMTIGGQLDD